MYHKFIQLFSYAVLALPALPPVVLPFFQPYTFGKTELFEILVECMALVYAVTCIAGKSVFNQTPIARGVLIFIGASLLSTLFSASPFESFWGSSARMDGFFTLLHFGLFFFILTSTFKVAVDWNKLIRWSVFVSAFVALYGIAQWFELPFVRASEGTIFSTLGNPTFLATYALFHVFLSLFLAQRALSREARASWAIIATCNILIILLTKVAGVQLGLVAGLAVAFFPYIRTHTSAGVILFLAGILLFNFASFPEHALSLQTRISVWRIALISALDQPIIGHGPNQFERAFLSYKERGYAVPATGETFDKPHNAYLETFFNYGIIGLTAYLYLLWSALVASQGLIRAALIGYLISLFFFFDTFSSLLIFFFLIAHLSRHENALASPVLPPSPRMILALVLGAFAFFFIFHFKPLHSAYWAYRGIEEKALFYHSFNSPFIERAFLLEQNRK